MLPSPHSFLPARLRETGRIATPVVLAVSLMAGSLAVVSASISASAAPTVGTFAIGDAAVELYQPSDPEMGVLKPTADAAQNGMFGAQFGWPLIPLHAALTRDGRIVSYGTPTGGSVQDGLNFDEWNPAGGFAASSHITTESMNHYDSFCSALVTLPDGRMLMASGDSYRTTMIYDPTTQAQTQGADLNYYRWYTTALRLTDDRVLLIGGANPGDVGRNATPDQPSGIAITPEIGTGTGVWTQLLGATSETLFGNTDGRWWYPRAFIGPNGGVVGLSGDRIWSLDPNGNGSVQETGALPFNPRTSGSQVMYAPGKVLVAGGGSAGPADKIMGNSDAAIVDFNGLTPVITSVAPMASARTWLNLTVLPNGEVLANGGTRYGTAAGDENSVKQAEIWNPTTAQWRTAATAQRTRTYHSTSLVLPSGAVFTGGGGAAEYTGSGGVYGPENNLNAELYYPSYLFAKNADGTVQWASRPTITSIAGSATVGGTVALTVGDGRGIASASLINVPSVTHGQNTDQRRVPLDFTQQGNTVSAALPGSLNAMPPGDYELTVVDQQGVPSPAQIITIQRNGPGLVTVSSNAPPAAAGGNGGVSQMPGMPMGDETGTGTGGGTGTSAGTGTGAGAGKGTGSGTTTSTAVTLTTGRSIGLVPSGKSTYRVTHAKTKVSVKKTSTKSSKVAKKSSSWIVRTGLGSKKGYSFESVDKPGYYLAAPLDGWGSITLVKKSPSASFKKRVTFSAVKSLLKHDTSFRLTATPSRYLRTDGSRLVITSLPKSTSGRTAATFTVAKGLASKK